MSGFWIGKMKIAVTGSDGLVGSMLDVDIVRQRSGTAYCARAPSLSEKVKAPPDEFFPILMHFAQLGNLTPVWHQLMDSRLMFRCTEN